MLTSLGLSSSSSSSSSLAFARRASLPPLPHVPNRLRPPPWQPRFILDPGGDELLKWNRIFLVSCLIALFLDPLYFYLLYIGGDVCMVIDLKIGVTVTVFRTITDFFYLFHLVLKFHTAFVAPSSRVFGRGELVRDPHKIAMRYIKKDFIFDLVATLPIPQFVIWGVIPAVSNSSNHSNNTLCMLVLFQYIPRLLLIFPLNARIVKANGVVTKTAWAGAAYNLLLYMLASHALGSLWYLLSMERQYQCWQIECGKENGTMNTPKCELIFLDCNRRYLPERKVWLNSTKLIHNCNAQSDDVSFKFGIFSDALSKDIVGASFAAKYLYCLWWGLRNLRYPFLFQSTSFSD